MTTEQQIKIDKNGIIFADLVGREIRLKTEQFQNRVLTTRVLAVSDNCFVIDRSGSSGMVDRLIPNQKVDVEFGYKGQFLGFNSRIQNRHEGRLVIPIAREVLPMNARQFARYRLESEVQLALFDEHNISAARLNKLKWLKTSTTNLSGGGMLVIIPGIVTGDCYMILHLPMNGIDLPKLIVGRTRYFLPGQAGKNQVGVEFIIREDRQSKLPRTIIRNLPEKLFEYDAGCRQKLSRHLAALLENEKQGDIG